MSDYHDHIFEALRPTMADPAELAEPRKSITACYRWLIPNASKYTSILKSPRFTFEGNEFRITISNRYREVCVGSFKWKAKEADTDLDMSFSVGIMDGHKEIVSSDEREVHFRYPNNCSVSLDELTADLLFPRSDRPRRSVSMRERIINKTDDSIVIQIILSNSYDVESLFEADAESYSWINTDKKSTLIRGPHLADTYLYESRFAYDTIVIVGSEEIKCHRAFLAAGSEHFRNLFANESFLENKISRIDLKEVDVHTFQLLLRYLYLNELEIDNSSEDLTNLIILCDRFQVKHLADSIVITESNVLRILDGTISAPSQRKLQETCLDYLMHHYRQIPTDGHARVSFECMILIINTFAEKTFQQPSAINLDLLCDRIIQWIRFDYDNRKQYVELYRDHRDVNFFFRFVNPTAFLKETYKGNAACGHVMEIATELFRWCKC